MGLARRTNKDFEEAEISTRICLKEISFENATNNLKTKLHM